METCKQCGIKFNKRRPSRPQPFCSRQCAWKAQEKKSFTSCVICGTQFLKRVSSRPIKLCSKECKNKHNGNLKRKYPKEIAKMMSGKNYYLKRKNEKFLTTGIKQRTNKPKGSVTREDRLSRIKNVNKIHSDNLSDTYCARTISQKTNLKPSQIPKPLIELKRIQLQIKRHIKQNTP